MILNQKHKKYCHQVRKELKEQGIGWLEYQRLYRTTFDSDRRRLRRHISLLCWDMLSFIEKYIRKGGVL